MVLNYYGKKLTTKEVTNSLTKSSDGHTHMTEIARFVHQYGLIVDCLAYNLFYTDPTDSSIAQWKLLKKFESMQQSISDAWYKERINSTVMCMREGVNYRIEKPTVQTISAYLSQGVPLIIAVNTCVFYNRQGDPYDGHDIVLSGIDGNLVQYIDPWSAQVQTLPIEDLLIAILARKVIVTSAYAVAIAKG